jgi:hypothetical protein
MHVPIGTRCDYSDLSTKNAPLSLGSQNSSIPTLERLRLERAAAEKAQAEEEERLRLEAGAEAAAAAEAEAAAEEEARGGAATKLQAISRGRALAQLLLIAVPSSWAVHS